MCGTRCPGLDASGDAGPGQPHGDGWLVPTCKALSQQSRRCLETQRSSFQNLPGLSRSAVLLLNPSISAADTNKGQTPSPYEVLGVHPPLHSPQPEAPHQPGRARLGFCGNGACCTPGPRAAGRPGAEAALPERLTPHAASSRPWTGPKGGMPVARTCSNHAGGSACDRKMTRAPATRALLLTKSTLLCKAQEPPVASKKKRFQSDPKRPATLCSPSLIRILFVKTLSRKVPVRETGQPGVGLLPRDCLPILLPTLTPAPPPPPHTPPAFSWSPPWSAHSRPAPRSMLPRLLLTAYLLPHSLRQGVGLDLLC